MTQCLSRPMHRMKWSRSLSFPPEAVVPGTSVDDAADGAEIGLNTGRARPTPPGKLPAKSPHRPSRSLKRRRLAVDGAHRTLCSAHQSETGPEIRPVNLPLGRSIEGESVCHFSLSSLKLRDPRYRPDRWSFIEPTES